MHLFIDTTEFDRNGRNILHHDFVHAKAFAVHGLLELVVPDVTAREWRAHLEASLGEWSERAHSSVQKLEERAAVESGGQKGVLDALAQSARCALEEFFSADGVRSLPNSMADLDAIVDDYFAGRAPFGGGKKKSEFPDAIVAASLVAYAQEQKSQVTVLSKDGDMRRTCERHSEHLRLATSLPEVLGEAWLADEGAGHDAVALALSRCETALLPLELVRSHLDGVEVTFDEGARCDARIDDVSVDELVSLSLYAVGVDTATSTVEITGELRVRISATIYSDDPDYVYRDSDTKELFCLARQHESVTATVATDVSGFVDLEGLLAGHPEWGDLEVATSGSLEMDDFTISDRGSSADEPDWHGDE